jgi:translation elongation factor EF-1beta
MEYNVAATVKIYLEDNGMADSVKSEIEKIAKVNNFREEDVGFGIKVLRAVILFNDDKGGLEELEEKIKKISGVSEIQVEDVSRI